MLAKLYSLCFIALPISLLSLLLFIKPEVIQRESSWTLLGIHPALAATFLAVWTVIVLFVVFMGGKKANIYLRDVSLGLAVTYFAQVMYAHPDFWYKVIASTISGIKMPMILFQVLIPLAVYGLGGYLCFYGIMYKNENKNVKTKLIFAALLLIVLALISLIIPEVIERTKSFGIHQMVLFFGLFGLAGSFIYLAGKNHSDKMARLTKNYPVTVSKGKLYEFPYQLEHEHDTLNWEQIVGDWADKNNYEVDSVSFDKRWGYKSVIVKVKVKDESKNKSTVWNG